MTEFRIALEGASIVIKGLFGPTMFSPSWFAQTELLGSHELSEPRVEVISPEFTSFTMGWLTFVATPDSLQFSTDQVDELPRLRDVAVGVLRMLPTAPVASLGINRESHTELDSIESLHEIGDLIAPKDVWSDLLDFPALRAAVIWGARTDGWGGNFNIKVEPSVRLPHAVYIATNDHVELAPYDAPTNRNDAYDSLGQEGPSIDKRELAMNFLNSDWRLAMDRATRAYEHVIGMPQSGRQS